MWSYSKLSTFKKCNLRYKLSYIDKYYVDDEFNNVHARKGSFIHEVLEFFINNPLAATDNVMIMTEIPILLQKYSFTSIDEIGGQSMIDQLKNFYISEFKQFEGKIQSEKKYYFKVGENEEEFQGIIDALVIDNDTYHIYDYKTSAKVDLMGHKDQMLLYVYALCKEFGMLFEEAAKKVKVKLYFPFAGNVLKELKFNEVDIQGIECMCETTIQRIKNLSDFEFYSSVSRLCDWCPFKGSKDHCKDSAEAGFYMVRGTKIQKRVYNTTP